VVIHLVVTPEQAHERVLARGTDAETLEELDSFRAAYEAIPEYARFTELAADGTPEEVLAKLTVAIADAGRTRAADFAAVVNGSDENGTPGQDVIHGRGSGHTQPRPDEAA
jgi:dTMP kinase